MNQSVIHSDPQMLGGTPVFRGTRVPAGTLLDYLEAGQTIEDFQSDFPSVPRAQAIALLKLARRNLQRDASAAR